MDEFERICMDYVVAYLKWRVETTTQQGTSLSVFPSKYYFGDQIKKKRWAGHVARMRDRTGSYTILVVRPNTKRHFEKPGIDRRIILKLIFGN
jgi:ribosomal protein L34